MKTERVCKNCSKSFEVEKREVNQGGGIFCTRKCSHTFIVKENMKNYNPSTCQKEGCNNLIPYTKRHNLCCSRSCANSRIKTDEVKLKQSIAAKSSEKVKKESERRRGDNYNKIINCKNCGTINDINKKTIFCGENCRKEFRQRGKDKLRIYRTECKFKFSLNDYPEEFDFSLVEKYGWYSPSNKKNNLDGISRDHIMSVKDGFIFKINPEIISHPANCRLITQRDNSSKRSKSLVTLDELQDKIRKWNEKYNC